MGKPIASEPKGFTLIELIVYLGITAIALLVFTSFMVDVTKNASRTHASTETQRNARLVLSRLTQEIRTARAIQTVNAQDIRLTSQGNETVEIFLSGTSIAYTVAGGPAQVLTNDDIRVSHLLFSQLENSIQIEMTLEQKNEGATGANKKEISLSSTVVPRQCIYSRSLCP